MLPNFVKETAATMALNIREKKRVWTNWPNIATKFARRGTHQSVLLSNWSSWRRAASAMQWTKFESNDQSATSPGESCARLPAGLRLHRHLWCLRWSTWSAQKRTVGIKKKQSVVLLQVTFVSPTICNCVFHMFGLAFQCCQILPKKQPWQWPLTLEKTRRLNELAKHRNEVCKTRHA